MDSQDYLDQISKSVRPTKQRSGLMNILTSKYFKWGLIALAALIIIMIFGSMLGNKPTQEENCAALKFHVDHTTQVIDEYQSSLKSSTLRSLSASLKGILTNTSSQLTNYMVAAYGYDERNIKASIIEEADLNYESLIEELFNAKINGLLDRTYAHKITLEIYTIMSRESSIANATSDNALKSLLSTSYDSLNNLYNNFNDFSETK